MRMLVGRACGFCLTAGGVVVLVFLSLVSFGDPDRWGDLMVAIGMPLLLMLGLAGFSLAGWGLWILLRRPSRDRLAAP